MTCYADLLTGWWRLACRKPILRLIRVGFGKTSVHNAEVISWLSLFHGLGAGNDGVSRKSSIPKMAASGGYNGGYGASSKDRLGGSLALTLAATAQGAQIVRTHDVAETVQAVAVQKGLG